VDYPYLTIESLGTLLRRREVSAVELARMALRQVEATDGDIGAFLLTTRDRALDEAARADEQLARGDAHPLTGIPMAIKDILSTEGIRTTCGSRMLEGYVPQYSATVVERLRCAGSVLVGKTNMDEFAMGSSNENSAFWPVHNPWDLERVPGGSSGGSAAAVASGQVPFALGTDTGGSIRQPAAFTGTVGLKPTYGRVSRYGLVAFASSLDQIGPFAGSVHDAALVLSTIAGWDPLDSTSVNVDVPDYAALLATADIRGMRIGIPQQYFGEGMQREVRTVIEAALGVLEDLGASLVEVSLPHTEYALSTYYVVSPAEAMANLARYDGIRYGLSEAGEDVWETYDLTREHGFGREVKRRILLGSYVLSAGYYDAYYLKAQRVRTLVQRDFEQVFDSVDILAAPTTPTVAFRLGEKIADPMQMYLSDVYTVPANIAGIPALSVPAGLANGLPVGLQFLAKPFDELTMLQAAFLFEQATVHHKNRPADRQTVP
jgi:aspartyl-tRNA(Asn)/glutamyl-tRNA(Gln) amidotransferase subunit A